MCTFIEASVTIWQARDVIHASHPEIRGWRPRGARSAFERALLWVFQPTPTETTNAPTTSGASA